MDDFCITHSRNHMVQSGRIKVCEICDQNIQDISVAAAESVQSAAWSVETARRILKDGVKIQALGPATDAVITGLIKVLVAHIDEQSADLKAAIGVGRAAILTERTFILEWLETEISSIPTYSNGSTNMHHDAYWMKSEVYDLLKKAREIFGDAK